MQKWWKKIIVQIVETATVLFSVIILEILSAICHCRNPLELNINLIFMIFNIINILTDDKCDPLVNTGLFEMIVGVLTTCHTQYTWDTSICVFFYLIEQHSKFLLHTLQVLYMCILCDSTNIDMIIEFVPHVSGDGFNGGSDSYLQLWDTHTPCPLKLCIPPSNGIVRWWLFPKFGTELPLDNCIPTIILSNPVFVVISQNIVFNNISNILNSLKSYPIRAERN